MIQIRLILISFLLFYREHDDGGIRRREKKDPTGHGWRESRVWIARLPKSSAFRSRPQRDEVYSDVQIS
jgi:hypothetical protein